MSEPFYVNKPADLERLIGITQAAAPHRLPLLQAVRAGVLSLCELTREAPLPTRKLERCPRPVIVLIGDDDGLDCGPDGWRARPRLAGWARHAFIHATGGDVPSYDLAVSLALERRSLVLIETGSVHGMNWHRLFARCGVPTVNLVPRNGSVHPVPTPRGHVH